jgi:hypothetical protein
MATVISKQRILNNSLKSVPKDVAVPQHVAMLYHLCGGTEENNETGG